MRASKIWPALCISLLATQVVAQTSPGTAPPKLERIEEVDEPITVTTKPESNKQITEKREGGRVTEARVRSGKSAYTVKANTPAGSALPGDAAGQANRGGTTWTVMEFDIMAKKKKRSEEEAEKADVPPPPAPPSSSASH